MHEEKSPIVVHELDQRRAAFRALAHKMGRENMVKTIHAFRNWIATGDFSKLTEDDVMLVALGFELSVHEVW
jgi:hypothetical protein